MNLCIYSCWLSWSPPWCPRQRTPAPISFCASEVLVTHHRREDKDRLTATKAVVLEYLGRCDAHMHLWERGGYSRREEPFAIEPEVLNSSLGSGVCVVCGVCAHAHTCAVLGRVLSPAASVSLSS